MISGRGSGSVIRESGSHARQMETAGFFKSRSRNRPTRGKPKLLFDRLETRDLLTNLPPGFSESVVASGLVDPTAMALRPMAACSFLSKPASCGSSKTASSWARRF